MKTFNLVGLLRVSVIGVAVLCGASLVSGVVDAARLARFKSDLWSNTFYAWNLNWDSLNRARALLAAFEELSPNAYAQEIPTFRMGNSFEDAHAASCRVRVNGARGSGIFFGVDDDGQACILTNYHVVTNNQIAAFDFWKDGRLQTVTGSISWKAYNANEPYDFAIGKVKASDLKLIDPPWIPLAGSDAAPKTGAMIVSSGAPDGRFTQAWKGQVLEYYSGKTAIFSPPPVPGQSGSAICEYVDGQLFVTGVLTWLIGEKGRDDSKGGAIPIANLYKALRERGVNVDYVDPNASPIPPNATECMAAAIDATPNGGRDGGRDGATPDYELPLGTVNPLPLVAGTTKTQADQREANNNASAAALTKPVFDGAAPKAKAPCVLEFTQSDCPPCKDAENDVAQLRAFGVDVYVYDVATERGAEYATRYGVDRTPTFVLLDEKFKTAGTFTGAGVYSKIRDAHEVVISRLRKESQLDAAALSKKSSEGGAAISNPPQVASPSTLEQAAVAPQIINTPANSDGARFVTPKFVDETGAGDGFSSLPSSYSSTNPSYADGTHDDSSTAPAPLNLPAITPLLKEDFRAREPVFEPAFSMSGIFDKSDERWQDWKKRGRDDGGEDGSEDKDGSDDSCKRPKIGERLADGAAEAIISRIEKYADGRIQGVKDGLVAQWKAARFKLIMILCLLVAVGVLFAEGVVAGVKFAWRKVGDKAREIHEAVVAFKESQSGGEK